MFFGCHCLEVARSHVHCGSVLSAELLSHPFGAWHACRGRERARTGCALRRLVAVEPLVAMFLAYDRTVLCRLSIHCASTVQQLLLYCRHSLQHCIAAISADCALALCVSTSRSQPAQHTAHSAAHEQHTRKRSASYTQCIQSTSPAIEMAKSALAQCVGSSVANLSGRWHADGSLVCACSPRVPRSIPPSLLLPSSVD